MLDEIGAFKRIQHFVQHRKFRMLDEMLDPFKSAFIVKDVNIESCADDNTLHDPCDSIEEVISSLQSLSKKLFQ